MKNYTLPPSLEAWIDKQLKNKGFGLHHPKPLSEAILQVSDGYQNTDSVTPWQSPAHWAAYLCYFFPLNYIRSLKVIDEAHAFSFFDDIQEAVDFGCGPGTVSKALIQDPGVSISKYHGMDSESRLGALFLDTPRSEVEMSFIGERWPRISKKSLLIASYTLNEIKETPTHFFDFEKILIIEPSTHQAFPGLLNIRKELIEKDYQILAPCPHTGVCPLSHSKKDWCHDRVHWSPPKWFQDIEKWLPMKNRTLTMSYLLASRTTQNVAPYQRIVGDPQKEKGKTRWMLCRGEEREFLSHLKKQGRAPELHRGDRITIEQPDVKGNEVRFDAAHIQDSQS